MAGRRYPPATRAPGDASPRRLEPRVATCRVDADRAGTADLSCRFVLRGELIERLDIAP